MPAEYYLSSRHTFGDAVSEPVQSRLTGDFWTNLAGNQSNSFGLMLPRCARQTTFSETFLHYRIGLISEHLVQSQKLIRSTRCSVQCQGLVLLETIRQLRFTFYKTYMYTQRHFTHELSTELFFEEYRAVSLRTRPAFVRFKMEKRLKRCTFH